MTKSTSRGVKREREEEGEEFELDNDSALEDGVHHYLTFKDGGSDKFYEISVAGHDVLCRYGRAGSAGVTTLKSFQKEGSEGICSFMKKVLREKIKKGYVEQSVASRQIKPSSKKKKSAVPSSISTHQHMSDTDSMEMETQQQEGENSEDSDQTKEGNTNIENNDAMITPDPIGISLIHRKTKTKAKAASASSHSSSIEVAADPSSGEPVAALLSMPAASASSLDKFYHIQLLVVRAEEGKGTPVAYFVFSRWGNVGEVGNTELSPLLETFPLAVQAFEQRFKIKTANPWSDRESFVPKSFHFQLGQAGHVQAESRTVTSSSSSKPKIPGSSQATQKSTPAAAAAASASSTTKKAPSSAASSSSDKSVVRVVFLECREGSADKFYELKQTAANKVLIRYGRRLTAGVSSEKAFPTAAKAKDFVEKTAIAKLRKGYSHAKPDKEQQEQEEEEEEGAGGGVRGQEEATGDPAVDLENGLKVFVQGGSKLPYTLKKFQGGYSCTCRGWVGQIRLRGIQAASCKHLKGVRGEAEEATRCQSSAGVVANPSAKKNKNPSIVSRVSLAAKWKPSINPTGYLMSEKLDGMRAYWCGRQLWTRSGLPIVTPEWFTTGFPADVELDGELFLGRKLFDECMSITRRTDASEDWRKIKYVVFDAPQVAGGIASRLEAAGAALAESGNTFAMVHPHTVCEGEEHLLTELAAMEQLDGEGMMLRHPTAAHRGGRNVDLLKVKSFHDAEAIVTDYEEGKGKYAGMVGSLVCRSRQGAAFKVGSGLVDSQRSYQSKSLPPRGSVITFQYFELTKDGIPRFPTFQRIRPDVEASEFA